MRGVSPLRREQSTQATTKLGMPKTCGRRNLTTHRPAVRQPDRPTATAKHTADDRPTGRPPGRPADRPSTRPTARPTARPTGQPTARRDVDLRPRKSARRSAPPPTLTTPKTRPLAAAARARSVRSTMWVAGHLSLWMLTPCRPGTGPFTKSCEKHGRTRTTQATCQHPARCRCENRCPNDDEKCLPMCLLNLRYVV